MKRVISTIAVLFILLAFIPYALAGSKAFQVNTLSGGSLLTNLLSYYNMQGNSNDYYGSNNGSDSSMTYGTPYGIVSQGAYCNGAATIYIGTGIAPTSTWSFAWWGKLSATGVGEAQITRRGNGANDWELFTDGSKQYIYLGSGMAYASPASASAVSTSWQFWVVTYDGANVRWYLNGTLDSTNAESGSLATYAGGTVNFCEDNENGGPFSQYTGNLDEFGIWYKTLSQNEITDLYNAGAGQTMCNGTGGPACAAAGRRKIIIISEVFIHKDPVQVMV